MRAPLDLSAAGGTGAWRWAVPAGVVALAAAIALAASSRGDGWVALLLGAVLALCGVGVAFSAVNGLRPVALVFFAFVFSWLGVAPVYQLATGDVPWGDATALRSRETVLVALGLTVIAVASFWLGTLVALRGQRFGMRGAATRIPSALETPAPTRIPSDVEPRAPRRIPRRVEPRRWAAWLLIGVAVAISPLVIAGHGGIATFFGSRLERDAALIANGITLENVGGAQYAVVTILPVALSIAAAVLAVERLRPFARSRDLAGAPLGAWLTIAAAAALLVLYANPFTNSRFIASLAFGTLALAVFRPRSRAAAAVVAAITLGVVLVAYPVAELFRGALDGSPEHFGLTAFGTYDFDGFLQLTNAVEHVGAHGHTLGWYLVSALAFAVPRSMWGAKAQPASIDVAEGANYQFTNLSLPIHGELFLEFGLVGVVVGMTVIGWAAARVDSAWLAGDTTRLTVLAPVLALTMLGLVRGPLGSLVPIYGAAIVFVLMGLRRERGSVSGSTGSAGRTGARATAVGSPRTTGARATAVGPPDAVRYALDRLTPSAHAGEGVPDALGAAPGTVRGGVAVGAAAPDARARERGLVATHAHPEFDDLDPEFNNEKEAAS